MTTPINYKYHSTGQFRNACKHIQMSAKYKGRAEDGKALYDELAQMPLLTYIGSVKLHGTNASIVLHENGDVSFHSKERKLGYVDGGTEDFHLEKDNAEFAQTMWRRFSGVVELVNDAVEVSWKMYGEVRFPIKISGEWAGPGIQKGVGVSGISQKTLFIFGIKFGDTDQGTKSGWCSPTHISHIKVPEKGIRNIYEFPTKSVIIDFSTPDFIQNTLAEATFEVEAECPVSKALGVEGDLVGEGLVWIPVSDEYCWDTGTWFKTKGDKHSTSKVKKVASVDPEKLASIQEFIEYAVTENRLNQGIGEVGLDQKLVGQFIGWVNRDVNKEEGDVLEASNLSMKDVGKYISTKARAFYFKALDEESGC
jgi:hypothetical protein